MQILNTRAIARRAASLASTALVAGVLALAPAAAQEGDVLARVNGKDITKTEVDLALDVFGEQLAQVPEAARRTIVLDALIDMHVIADAAKADGLDQSQKFKDRMSFLSAQALRNTYIEEKVQGAVTDEELKARYEKDLAGYEAPEEVKARHILVKTEEEARAIIKDLDGGADFAKIAAEKSQDPGSKVNGGDLGFFTKGQMVPEFETAAFALQPGAYTKDPVQSQFGWHVIKTDEKRTQPAPTFEEVREQVASVVQREKFQEVLGDLKGKAKVERLDQAAEAPAAAPGAAPAEGAPAAGGAPKPE
ncbi:peptidylprolyl isomerase [Chthonobacter rhizosphaerae]|uniref:peptidylprolyl isomerase n=1 Tax=Chthonobacter rhizosphaerae TaxID=2735553 RepID=UPI0015EE6D4D|nr:peptidylprolyl isomerase [Chthonobacter rhizosphaerae]